MALFLINSTFDHHVVYAKSSLQWLFVHLFWLNKAASTCVYESSSDPKCGSRGGGGQGVRTPQMGK